MRCRSLLSSLAWFKVRGLGEEPTREREGPSQLRLLVSAGVCAALLTPLAACGGNAPQIVDYAPQRNAVDVSTAAPIKITFDHAVDRGSIETRLRLAPPTTGSVRWLSDRQLVYEHPTLRTNTTYEVILEAGYRDMAGDTYSLRHHWSFRTEGAPAMVGSTPSDGDTGVDPSAYLTIDFSRSMAAATLRSALTFVPAVPFDVRLDPTDSRRAIIAPAQLLNPNTAYELAIDTAALDVDGNQLDRDQTISFTTGAPRPLKHWITFATHRSDGSSGALWMVNEAGFPRQLFALSPVIGFNWSPAGDAVLIESDGERWSELVPGNGAVALPFKATWASALAPGMGYVYIDESGTLHRMAAGGADEVIAADVAQASVAPTGLRVAFIEGAPDPNEIWGYDVGLRARYELALDSGPVTAIAWAPAGNRIAYLRADVNSTSLRVRNLAGAGTTVTVASGDLGSPVWLADSTHVVLEAAVQGPTGVGHKAFIVNVVAPPVALSSALGLPLDPAIDVLSPVPSPDGHQIAFLSGDQIWLMNADGSRPTPLTRFDPQTFPYSCSDPAWTKA